MMPYVNIRITKEGATPEQKAPCAKGTGTLTFQESCKCQRTCPLDIKKTLLIVLEMLLLL
jgi:hypothetical protein